MRSSVGALDARGDVRQHAESASAAWAPCAPASLRRPGLVEGDLELALEVAERLLRLLDRDVAPLHERLERTACGTLPCSAMRLYISGCV